MQRKNHEIGESPPTDPKAYSAIVRHVTVHHFVSHVRRTPYTVGMLHVTVRVLCTVYELCPLVPWYPLLVRVLYDLARNAVLVPYEYNLGLARWSTVRWSAVCRVI